MADTGEPTHIDDAGVERPGSQSLVSVVTPALVANAEAIWLDNGADNELRNRKSSANPHLNTPHSPLETLIEDAFSDFGNMSIDTLDGSVKRMFLRWANRIVEDMRIHPYFTYPDLDYYTTLQDIRPIPDTIMQLGLLYHYSKWQKSATAAVASVEYRTMPTQILYQRKYGSGQLQVNTVDKPTTVQSTNPPYKPGA